MPFSDTSNKSGLIQHCERLTNLGDAGISGTAQLLKEFTAEINLAFDEVLPLVYAADADWQWDDPNHSGQPVYTQTLTAGTGTYGIAADSDSASILEVERVYIRDAVSGQYVVLRPAETQAEIDTVLAQNTTRTGQPTFYVKRGTKIILDSLPSYTAGTGVKIVYRRGPSYFASTDTTKQPGIPRFSHQLLSLIASRNWLMVKKSEERGLITDIERQIVGKKADLDAHLSRRSRDTRTVMRPNRQSSR